jgi:hypothetical protein
MWIVARSFKGKNMCILYETRIRIMWIVARSFKEKNMRILYETRFQIMWIVHAALKIVYTALHIA